MLGVLGTGKIGATDQQEGTRCFSFTYLADSVDVLTIDGLRHPCLQDVRHRPPSARLEAVDLVTVANETRRPGLTAGTLAGLCGLRFRGH